MSMDEVFVKLFNMSMAAGWMILAVLLLRLLLRKAPHWMHCLLWGFVAVRLICPVSFQSVLSLIPRTETIHLEEVRYGEQPQIQSGVQVVDRVVSPVLEHAFTPDVSDSVNLFAVWMQVAAVIWLLVTAALLIYAFVKYVQLQRQVRFAARLSENVWQCDEIHVPFVFGIIRPRIYLPSGMDEASMDYVLAHERAHLKRFDHWWKPLGYVLLSVYWFHPLVWAAYVLFCRDMELACDEKVIRVYDMDEKKAYSAALLAMSMNRRQAMVCPLAFGEVGVKARVKSVLHYKKPAFWVLVTAAAACVAVAVCFLTDPKADAETADAAETALRDKLENELGGFAKIRVFFYEDLNNDGQKEALAITSQTTNEFGYSYAQAWYVTDQTCDPILVSNSSAAVYPDTVHLYELSNAKMFSFTSGWTGVVNMGYAWVYYENGEHGTVENVQEGISQISEDEFMVTSRAFDELTQLSGPPNRYFSRWDGEKLVEYGGLEISEEQLREAKNADWILDDVKVYGEIQSIFYRANGMVFINLYDGSQNRNVALVLTGDKLSYFDYGESGAGKKTALEKATADGVILESVTSCVAYPDKFPLDGSEDAREKHAMITYMLDAPNEMPVTLYEGDGFSIYVPDVEDLLISDKTLEAPGRLSVVWGHSTFIEVMCYEGKTKSYVEEELEKNGYAYDAVYDTGGKKMQKEEDYRLLSEARLQSSGDDVWVVCTTYASAYDFGSQLDAIADTFQVTSAGQ